MITINLSMYFYNCIESWSVINSTKYIELMKNLVNESPDLKVEYCVKDPSELPLHEGDTFIRGDKVKLPYFLSQFYLWTAATEEKPHVDKKDELRIYFTYDNEYYEIGVFNFECEVDTFFLRKVIDVEEASGSNIISFENDILSPSGELFENFMKDKDNPRWAKYCKRCTDIFIPYMKVFDM